MAKKRDQQQSWQPDATYVQALYHSRVVDGDEDALRTRAAEMRRLTDMTHEVDVPEQYRAITSEVRTPFARDSWLRVTAALTQYSPVAHVDPVDDSEESKKAANIAERWTMAATEAMNEDVGEDVVYESTKALIRDGQSFIKCVLRGDAWSGYPRRSPDESPDDYRKRADAFKRRARFPFAWRLVDRFQLLPGEGEFGLVDMVEYGEYPILDTARRYGMPLDGGMPRNPENLKLGVPKPEGALHAANGYVVKMEYWDRQWWHVVVDGEDAPGFPRPNPYGQLPYFRAKVSEPVLMALKWLVPGLDALLTMKMNWAYLGAYPNPVLEPIPNAERLDIPGGDDGNPAEFVWKPGKMIQPPFGYRFGFVSPPAVGQDIDEMIRILRELIDVAGIPSVFRGIGGADQAGYAINQLIAAATLTYRVLAQSLQRQLQDIGQFLWHCVRQRIKQTVYIDEQWQLDGEGRRKRRSAKQWLGLKPEGSVTESVAPVDRLAKLSYSFRPVLPTDQQARSMIALQLTNAQTPLYDPETALERLLQEEDPQRILDKIYINQKLSDPSIDQLIVERAMKKAGVYNTGASPLANLVNPRGEPILGSAPEAYPPGQVAAGLASVPGLTQQITPNTPSTPAILPGAVGGRSEGMFPGQPGGARPHWKLNLG